ncbi:cytidine deaminase-like protein [Cladochytrium replicatum]|nr:cytidine deaminase-like protein [Cladochytrium replicatum]
MLIGLAGPICAGKRTVGEFLVLNYGFTFIQVDHNDTLCQSESSSTPPTLHFPTIDAAHGHVMKNWRTHFVLTPITNMADLEFLQRRPFFYLLTVEASTGARFRRYCERMSENGVTGVNFEESGALQSFLEIDDAVMYGQQHGDLKNEVGLKRGSLAEVLSRSNCRVYNTYRTIPEFFARLKALDLTNHERLRPGWDNYFMMLCELAAKRSNCMKRRVGAILVKERRIIATGYNGTPRFLPNCSDGGCARCNDGATRGERLDTCICLHAEEVCKIAARVVSQLAKSNLQNALLEAGRERIDNGKPAILYCNTCPCLGCAKKIIQSGVSEVVYGQEYGMDELTIQLFRAARIPIRQFKGSPDDTFTLDACIGNSFHVVQVRKGDESISMLEDPNSPLEP